MPLDVSISLILSIVSCIAIIVLIICTVNAQDRSMDKDIAKDFMRLDMKLSSIIDGIKDVQNFQHDYEGVIKKHDKEIEQLHDDVETLKHVLQKMEEHHE